MYKICDFTKGGIGKPYQQMGSLICKQKHPKKVTTFRISLFPWYEQGQQSSNNVMNTRDINTKSFEFGGELMISFIKPHMNNQITIECPVILRNPSGYTLIKLDISWSSDPPPPNDCKVRVCRVFQKTKHSPGYKKVIDFLRKVKARCRKYDHHLFWKHKFVGSQTWFENK